MQDYTPTTEPFSSGTEFSSQTPPETIGSGEDYKQEIVDTLLTYRDEAQEARRGGLNPRDDKWEQNLDLYWNRFDFSQKAGWQAKEVMPEVPGYVDRFAAALKEALVQTDFYTVEDPHDPNGDLTQPIKKMTDIWLSTAGRNASGTPLDFSSVFEEQMKMGALMASASVVTWRGDTKNGRVAVETVDPRMVWLDHTYRNLYRMRRTELDLYDLIQMKDQRSGKGKPIFNIPEIERLQNAVWLEDQRKKMELTGSGEEITSRRQPIRIEEWIATVVGPDGKVLADKALIVVANDQYIIRGPEKNPYWHNQDWMIFSPLVTAPLSVYGRSYMEDFGSVARTFTHLTNMILDAVQTSAMKAYAMVPGMLTNPGQAAEGLSPNKLFLLEEGFRAEDFAKAIDLGSLDQGAVQVWQSMKAELSEAAGINEIGLGQFAPNSRTSATEIMETQSSSSAIVRSIAQTVEARFLNPTLDLVWKTGLQHASPTDKRMADAVGPELYAALLKNRRELITGPTTFQAKGLSALISRSQMLQRLMQIMGVIAQNEQLTTAFMQRVDINKLVNLLFRLSNLDITTLEPTERERLIAETVAPMQGAIQQAQNAPQAEGPGAEQMGQVAASMGIGA